MFKYMQCNKIMFITFISKIIPVAVIMDTISNDNKHVN